MVHGKFQIQRSNTQNANFDELVKSLKIPCSVIPAKAGIQGSGVNQDPIFEMVPGFRRDDVWTPVFTGVTAFYETINFGIWHSFDIQILAFEIKNLV